MLSYDQQTEMFKVVETINAWPLEMRLDLAAHVLWKLSQEESARNPRRTMTIDEFHAAFPRTEPPPTDEDIARMKEEYLTEKYGR